MVEQLAIDYPDRFAPVTFHVNGDPYTIAWAQSRLDDFYRLASAVPTFVVDGQWICSTEDYRYWVEQQLTVPTDVTIEMSGAQVQGSTWDVTARVCLVGGSGRALRVQTAATLDGYPDPPHYSTNNLMQDVFTTDVNLASGACTDVTTRITFDSQSAANQSDIVVVAWAEKPTSSAPADVYQAAVMRWPFPAGSHLAAIDVSPSAVALEVGDSIQLSAAGRDQNGGPFPLTNPTWSLGTGNGAGTFNPSTGATTTFTATLAGTRQLVCSDGGVTGAAVATITEAPHLAAIVIYPATVEMEVGDQVSFTAEGRDQFGEPFALATPTWSLGTGNGAGTFDPSTGATTTFTATLPGTRQLVCSDGGISGAAVATITATPHLAAIVVDPATAEVTVGGQVGFSAEGRDQFGEPFALTGPAWTVSGNGGGSFDPATGTATVFTATTAGACVVTATEGGVTGTAAVEVTGETPYLAAIAVDPATATVRVGRTLDLTATGTDQYGDPFALVDPAWRVEGDGNGSFDPAVGAATTFTATVTGAVQLICAADGVEGSAAVTIIAAGLPAPRKVTKRVAP